jgi:hypothetical protein
MLVLIVELGIALKDPEQGQRLVDYFSILQERSLEK